MSLPKRLCVMATVVLLGLVLSACALLRGNEYPAQDITFIVPYAPGGTTDPVSRMLAQESEPLLNRKIIIVNKPGAAGSVGTVEMVQAKPDGYTIGLTAMATVALQPQVSKLPFGGPEDYQPIINVVELPNVLVVKGDAPFKTLDEFVAEARRRPGDLRVSNSGGMGTAELAMIDLKRVANIQLTDVPFSGGGGEAITALLGGHVEATSSYPGTVLPHVQAGKLRALAILGKARNPLLPDVPSAAELGYNMTVPGTIYFVIGPKGMNKAAVDKLYDAFSTAIKSPNFQKFAKENGEITDPVGPEELDKRIREYWVVYEKILKELKVE